MVLFEKQHLPHTKQQWNPANKVLLTVNADAPASVLLPEEKMLRSDNPPLIPQQSAHRSHGSEERKGVACRRWEEGRNSEEWSSPRRSGEAVWRMPSRQDPRPTGLHRGRACIRKAQHVIHYNHILLIFPPHLSSHSPDVLATQAQGSLNLWCNDRPRSCSQPHLWNMAPVCRTAYQGDVPRDFKTDRSGNRGVPILRHAAIRSLFDHTYRTTTHES
ncbi:unnamed protein product [Pleuronectes platessa]|uniref:Uncharacterized protein n=1 Tax=Pleuronectes platessa TaxID=8262 RepID=A0A9N7TMH4_PLEPL|nr:unnamed protein product [Pleuronectes platessa]